MLVNRKFNVPTIPQLFKSLKTYTSDWEKKTPLEKWCYLYAIGRGAFACIASPLMNESYHWLRYVLVFYTGITPWLAPYTVIYYAYHGEISTGLPSTCLACVCMSVSKIGIAFKLNFNSSIQCTLTVFMSIGH